MYTRRSVINTCGNVQGCYKHMLQRIIFIYMLDMYIASVYTSICCKHMLQRFKGLQSSSECIHDIHTTYITYVMCILAHSSFSSSICSRPEVDAIG